MCTMKFALRLAVILAVMSIGWPAIAQELDSPSAPPDKSQEATQNDSQGLRTYP